MSSTLTLLQKDAIMGRFTTLQLMRHMSTAFYEIVGARIKTQRDELGLRQEDLAESIGLSRTSVTNIERGRQRLFLDQFAEICRVLKVQPSDIFPDPLDPGLQRMKIESTAMRPASVQKFLASIDQNEEVSE